MKRIVIARILSFYPDRSNLLLKTTAEAIRKSCPNVEVLECMDVRVNVKELKPDMAIVVSVLPDGQNQLSVEVSSLEALVEMISILSTDASTRTIVDVQRENPRFMREVPSSAAVTPPPV